MFKIKSEDLNKALDIIKPAIGSDKSLIESLQNICIRDGEIQGYNGKLFISTKIKFPFNFMVVGDFFHKFINTLNDEIIFNLKKNVLEIKCKNINNKVSILDIKEFPVIDIKKMKDSFNITKGFIETIEKILPFVNKDDLNINYNGVYIDGEKIYATNGLALAKIILNKEDRIKIKKGIFLPENFCNELIRLKKSIKKLKWDKDNIVATGKNITVLCNRAKVELPEYEKIFKGYGKIKKLSKLNNEFLNAVNRAMIIMEKEQDKVCDIIFEGNILSLESSNERLGYLKEKVKIKKMNTKDKISVNIYYLSQALKECGEMGVIKNKSNKVLAFKSDNLDVLLSLLG